jgi:hypothetical protein
METPDLAMENVLTFVRSNEPTRFKWVQETYQKVNKGRSRARRGAAGGSAVATGTFPVQAARRKKIRYSGWIKTEGITRGFAGLWWRAADEAGLLAFDNMQDRGIKGDTDWTEYALELDIPEQVVNIIFGAILPGDVRAWGVLVESPIANARKTTRPRTIGPQEGDADGRLRLFPDCAGKSGSAA